MLIRSATTEDVSVLLELIRELAIYEEAENQALATSDQIYSALFDSPPTAFCELVLDREGNIAGFALWFKNFSTWTGTPGIYLEDLYIRPQFRGQGFGKSLLIHLAQKCIENEWQRFQWWVLDWNEPAINFYKSIGATAMEEWTVYRVSSDALANLAQLPISKG